MRPDRQTLLTALSIAALTWSGGVALAQPRPPPTRLPTTTPTKRRPTTPPTRRPTGPAATAAGNASVRALLGVKLTQTVEASEPLIVKRSSTERRQLLRWDLSSNDAKPLYRSKKDTVQDMAVSSDEKLVAAIETQDGVVDDNGEYSTPPQNQLVILDGSGRQLLTVKKDIQTFEFSPDGKRLAYVVGSYYEGGVGFSPKEAWVIDLTDLNKPHVQVPDVEHPFALDWIVTSDDSYLFLRALTDKTTATRADRVHRFSTAKKRTLPTDDPDAFYFSPDALFYMVPGADAAEVGRCKKRRIDDCTEVIQRQGRKKMTLQLPGRPIGWAYGQGALLLTQRSTGRETAETKVYDVRKKTVLERFDGVVNLTGDPEAWSGARTKLLVSPKIIRRSAVPTATAELFSVRHVPSALFKQASETTGAAVFRRTAAAEQLLVAKRVTSEPSVDRPGRDYRSVWLDKPVPGICEALCLQDARCKAYTYVKPGVQGPKARCYLKNAVPGARRNSCCVSGVKQG